MLVSLIINTVYCTNMIESSDISLSRPIGDHEASSFAGVTEGLGASTVAARQVFPGFSSIFSRKHKLKNICP